LTGSEQEKDHMTGKVCLITGGGSGISAAAAREMHVRGYKLALMSPSESCETLAAELEGVARRGVSQSASDIEAIFELTMVTYGRVDGVLNHTGHPPKGDLLEISDDNWDLANDMIVKSVVRMARHVTPVMEKQGGGSIVNITTYATFEPSLAFLLSDDSSYITGQSLRVDGGLARHM
jgi:NAD(P)-dependent dehydrogenase (short-subunit alcohol dehydrogenase family)